MNLTERQRAMYEDRAQAPGFVAEHLPRPPNVTLRQLSQMGGRGSNSTVRQSVGSGAMAHWNPIGTPIADQPVQDVVSGHLELSESTPLRSTYAAARWDDEGRPQDMLVLPNQRFGSHTRGPTESQSSRAMPLDHRGHGVAQASVMFPPGLHHALMTSQTPEMNTAVQLPFERGVDSLIADGRRPVWETHLEFSASAPAGQLPRPSHQVFTVMSTDQQGEDLRLHTHVRVAQR